jgi:hypothetical protein
MSKRLRVLLQIMQYDSYCLANCYNVHDAAPNPDAATGDKNGPFAGTYVSRGRYCMREKR